MPDLSKINNRRLICLTGVLFLTAAGLKWGWDLPVYNDFLFGDEAQYMRNGLDLFSVIRNDWGPAYNIWYKALSVFTNDPIRLYYLNYAAGAILVSVLLFLALMRLRMHALASLYLGFCFLISSLNINTWPRVSHFIVIAVLAGVIISTYLQSYAKKSLVFAAVCFIATYARPDLLFAFFIVTGISLIFIYRERTAFKSLLPYIAVLAAIILFFQLVFGLPASTYRGDIDRLYIAFGQHFTINYKMRTNADMDPVTDWLVFCRQHFPGANTLGDIVKNHPGEVLQNSLYNLKHYLLVFTDTLTSFIFPVKILHYKKLAYLALAAFAAAFVYVIFKKEKRQAWLSWIFDCRLILGFLLIFGLTSIGMSVIIFPRQHYLLLHSVFVLVFIAGILHVLLKGFTLNWPVYAAGCILLLFLSPKAGKYQYLQVNTEMKNLCSQKLVRYLEKKKNKPYVIFSSILNISNPLPKNYSEFNTEYELKEGMSFENVLHDKNINMVLVANNINRYPVLKKDTTWIQFIAAPEKFGFKKESYSEHCEGYLLIKE